jgi:hypothetical protein
VQQSKLARVGAAQPITHAALDRNARHLVVECVVWSCDAAKLVCLLRTARGGVLEMNTQARVERIDEETPMHTSNGYTRSNGRSNLSKIDEQEKGFNLRKINPVFVVLLTML